jgi:hypothetical protein
MIDQREKPYRYYHNLTHEVSIDFPDERGEVVGAQVPYICDGPKGSDITTMRKYTNELRNYAGLPPIAVASAPALQGTAIAREATAAGAAAAAGGVSAGRAPQIATKKKWKPHHQAQRKERQEFHTADVALARIKLWVEYDSTANSVESCLKLTDYAEQNGNDAKLVDPFLFPHHPRAVSQTVKTALRTHWSLKRFPETRPQRTMHQGIRQTWYPFLRLRTEAEVDALLAEDEVEEGAQSADEVHCKCYDVVYITQVIQGCCDAYDTYIERERERAIVTHIILIEQLDSGILRSRPTHPFPYVYVLSMRVVDGHRREGRGWDGKGRGRFGFGCGRGRKFEFELECGRGRKFEFDFELECWCGLWCRCIQTARVRFTATATTAATATGASCWCW